MEAVDGVSVELICVERINDQSVQLLAQTLSNYDQIVTAEAHSIRGGMGSGIAELLGESERLLAALTVLG